MNPARSVGTSATNYAWNLFRSKNRKPSLGGKIGGLVQSRAGRESPNRSGIEKHGSPSRT
jgi:hypothetical protein